MYARLWESFFCSCMIASSSLSVSVCSLCSFSGNNIGDEGVSVLAESLKQNTTLTNLNLEFILELWELFFAAVSQNQAHYLCIFAHSLFISVNNIGDEGTSALAESLKQNTTLTNLNLRSM